MKCRKCQNGEKEESQKKNSRQFEQDRKMKIVIEISVSDKRLNYMIFLSATSIISFILVSSILFR